MRNRKTTGILKEFFFFFFLKKLTNKPVRKKSKIFVLPKNQFFISLAVQSGVFMILPLQKKKKFL